MEFIKQQMGEGFAVNDTKTVQGAMDQLGHVQHQLNQIDPLLEHHDPRHLPDGNAQGNSQHSLTDRIRTVLGNLSGSLSEEDLKAGGTRPGPSPYESNLDLRLDYDRKQMEQAQTTFELHHNSPESQKRLLDFADRFDPTDNHIDRVAHQAIRGERNLAFEFPEIRDQVAEAIVDQITKFDLANMQEYHEIAEDITRMITRPMLHIAKADWQNAEDVYDFLETAKSSLDFVSIHSNKEEQLASFKQSLNEIADYALWEERD